MKSQTKPKKMRNGKSVRCTEGELKIIPKQSIQKWPKQQKKNHKVSKLSEKPKKKKTDRRHRMLQNEKKTRTGEMLNQSTMNFHNIFMLINTQQVKYA